MSSRQPAGRRRYEKRSGLKLKFLGGFEASNLEEHVSGRHSRVLCVDASFGCGVGAASTTFAARAGQSTAGRCSAIRCPTGTSACARRRGAGTSAVRGRNQVRNTPAANGAGAGYHSANPESEAWGVAEGSPIEGENRR